MKKRRMKSHFFVNYFIKFSIKPNNIKLTGEPKIKTFKTHYILTFLKKIEKAIQLKLQILLEEKVI